MHKHINIPMGWSHELRRFPARSAFRSKFIDNGFITMSGWGYVGAGVMDGVLGVMEAGEPDSAAWNLGGEPETSSWQFRTATLWPTKNPH